MHNEFTAVIEQDRGLFVGWCLRSPKQMARVQPSKSAAKSLSQAIALVLADRREDALRGLPATALRELVMVA